MRSPDFTFASKQWYGEDVLKSSLCQFCKIYVISVSKPLQFAGILSSNVSCVESYTHLDIQRKFFVGVMLGYYASPRERTLEVGSGEYLPS